MTEEQYQRLQQYMKLTRMNSTAYFCRLIQGDDFRGRSPKLNHALHASVNMIQRAADHPLSVRKGYGRRSRGKAGFFD